MPHFFERHEDGTLSIKVNKRRKEVLWDALLNKGTCFTDEERETFELVGLLPAVVNTPEQQAERKKRQAQAKRRIQQKKKDAKAKRTPIEDQLGLDADQRAALKALRLKHSADGKAIAQKARETKADRESVKKEYEALRSAFDKALREILTDEQEAKYDQILAGRQTKRTAK